MDGNSMLSTLEGVLNQAVVVQPLFAGTAMRLIGALAVIALSWSGIKILLEGDSVNSAIANLFKVMFIAGMATAIIGTNAGTGGLGRELVSGFDTIASQAGGGTDISTPGTMVKETLGKMLSAAALLMVGEVQNPDAQKASTPQGTSTQTQKSSGSYNPFEGFSLIGIIASLVEMLYKFFMAILLLITSLIFVGQFMITQIMVNIGLALMPVLVPWIVLDATAFIFHGWLKFMLVAGMTKVVGAIFFGLSLRAIDTAVVLANEGYAAKDLGQAFMAYAASFLIVGILAFLMLQATQIAQGLISGHGTGTFNPVGKLNPGAGATAAGRNASSAASAAAKGANKVAGAVSGAASGGVRGGVAGAKDGVGAAASGAMREAAAGGSKGFQRGATGLAKDGLKSLGERLSGAKSGGATSATNKAPSAAKAGSSGGIGALREKMRSVGASSGRRA